MLDLVKQIIDYYLKYQREPTERDLKITDESLYGKIWDVFVTIYHKWEVRWSAWNIKETQTNLIKETIRSTIEAISADSRFKKLTLKEAEDIKIRVDTVWEREILKDGDLKVLDPYKMWVIVIKRDYKKACVILPNMSPKLMEWKDFIEAIKYKLQEKTFNEKDYIIYSIKTISENDF